jgi:hypothetical protein
VTAAALQAADARLHNIPPWLRASLQPALELSRHTKQLLVQTDAHGKNGATAGQGGTQQAAPFTRTPQALLRPRLIPLLHAVRQPKVTKDLDARHGKTVARSGEFPGFIV